MDKTITKKKSLILKCIAVCLMVILHTFGFPNRIGNEVYISLGDINGVPIELFISNFGSICVGLFLFLSGYGMYQTYNENVNYKGIFNRLLKLYYNYWAVFLIFIPLGLWMSKYEFNINNFILNFFGLSSSYNAEWWFLRLYFMLMVLYPMFIKLLTNHSTKKVLLSSFLINIFGFIITKITYILSIQSTIIELISILFGGQFLFIFAISIAKNGYFDKIVSLLKWSNFKYKMITILYIPIMAVVIDIPIIGEIMKLVCIPVFIFLTSNCILHNNVMEWIGKHSTNIWLIHSFFCYYLFPKLTFLPQYSLGVFIWIMTLSLTGSYLIMAIFKVINIIHKPFLVSKLRRSLK